MRPKLAADMKPKPIGGGPRNIVEDDGCEEDEPGAEEASYDARQAAHDHHRQKLDRDVEVELFRRHGPVVAKREERTGHAAEKRADPKRHELVVERVHAEHGRRVVLFANRGERATECCPAHVQEEDRDSEASRQREVIARDVVVDWDAEEGDRRRLQRRLAAARYGRHMVDRPIHDILHRKRADGEIKPLHAKRGETEHKPDQRGEEPAGKDRRLERDARAHGVDRPIGANRHDGGVAEVDLPRPADKQVEAQRGHAPYDPGEKIAGKVEVRNEERRGQCEQQKKADLPALDRDFKESAVCLIACPVDARETIEHLRFAPPSLQRVAAPAMT